MRDVFKFLRTGIVALLLVHLVGCGNNDLSSPSQTSAIQSVSDRKISFVFGPIIRSIAIKDLENFINQGVANGDIGNILRFGNLPDTTLKTLLTTEYRFSLVQMSAILNTSVAEALLTKIGKAAHPRLAKDYAVQAIRAAIIKSLVADDTLSVFEVLKNLPVDLVIDVVEALKLANELGSLVSKK